MTKIPSIISFSLSVLAVCAAANPRVSDYRLDVTFDPERSLMQAVAVMALDSDTAFGDTASFYLHGELAVDSLFVDGQKEGFAQSPVMYYYDYCLIATRVSFGRPARRPLQLSVYYSGYFNRSEARSPSHYMRIDESGVFLRAYAYSLWFPIFLESNSDSYQADFPDVTLRVPPEYIPVFAGERIAEETEHGRRVSRWQARRLDLSAAQCTAQKFVVSSEGSLYLYYYDDPESQAMADSILKFVRTLNTEYSNKYRRHASSGQIHVMEMPRYGDISSANVTGITSEIWKQFESHPWSKRGLAHELVHPFVQTETKRGDSLFAFEIEGFPSYFHLPILAELFGESWYQKVMQETEDDYLKKRQTGLGWGDRPVPREIPLSQVAADQIAVYKDVFVLDDRALLALNWLYGQMGRDRFFEFTREMFNSGPVTFESFLKLALKNLPSAGTELHIWLNTTEYPERFRLKRR